MGSPILRELALLYLTLTGPGDMLFSSDRGRGTAPGTDGRWKSHTGIECSGTLVTLPLEPIRAVGPTGQELEGAASSQAGPRVSAVNLPSFYIAAATQRPLLSGPTCYSSHCSSSFV